MGSKERHLVNRHDGAKVSGWGKAREVVSEGDMVLHNSKVNGRDRKHVVQWLDWSSAEGATDATNRVILGDLEGLDETLWGLM